MRYIKFIQLITLVLLADTAFGQVQLPETYGKGIPFIAADSSFTVTINTRIQSRYDGYFTITDDTTFTDNKYAEKMWVRRARLKFGGYVLNPKITYKIEYDIVGGQVLDAVVMWNFMGNFSLWAGQTKLPGNRERLISSQKLQFVDRSLVNAEYNIDRDKGIQLRHHFKVGEIVIREISSVSIGEGKNYTTLNPNSGYDWTQRLEILPFGDFTSKGDYFCGDLKREETLKIAIGVTYDYNDNAIKEQGQRGDELSQMRDITTWFIDLMVKYQGLSLMAEYANKSTTESSAYWYYDGTDWTYDAFRTGTGVNLQLGYLLKNNWEFAGRYTQIDPEVVSSIFIPTQTSAYTFGISKYIVGHTLKFQTDVSLVQTTGSDDMVEFRLQFELGI